MRRARSKCSVSLFLGVRCDWKIKAGLSSRVVLKNPARGTAHSSVFRQKETMECLDRKRPWSWKKPPRTKGTCTFTYRYEERGPVNGCKSYSIMVFQNFVFINQKMPTATISIMFAAEHNFSSSSCNAATRQRSTDPWKKRQPINVAFESRYCWGKRKVFGIWGVDRTRW